MDPQWRPLRPDAVHYASARDRVSDIRLPIATTQQPNAAILAQKCTNGHRRDLVRPIKSSWTPTASTECVAVAMATTSCGNRTTAAIESSQRVHVRMVNGSNQKAMVTASAERRRVLKPRATGGTFTGKRGLPARPAATNPSPEDRAGAVITSSSTISQRKKPAVSPSTDRCTSTRLRCTVITANGLRIRRIIHLIRNRIWVTINSSSMAIRG